MDIHRASRDVGGWTVTDNGIMQDASMSCAARIAAYTMLSHPDWWEWSYSSLAKAMGVSRKTASRAVAELCEHGYMRVRREASRDRSGAFRRGDWELWEDPPWKVHPAAERWVSEHVSHD